MRSSASGPGASGRRYLTGTAPLARPAGYSFCLITDGARPELLRKSVESIRRLSIPSYEILVAGIPPEGLGDVHLLPMPEAARAGRLGEMRNALCRQARFDRLVVADDDILFHADFYSGLAAMEDYDVLSVRALNPDGSRYWDWATIGGPTGHRLMFYDEVDDFVYVSGHLTVLRASVADAVQWDPDRGFYQAEDVDFSRRVLAAGFRIDFCPGSTVTHGDARYTQSGAAMERRPIPRVPPRWTRPAAAPVLGVVITVTDGAGALPNLLASIAEAADEVTVVDWGTTDGLARVCDAWGVRLISGSVGATLMPDGQPTSAPAPAFLLRLNSGDEVPADAQEQLRRLAANGGSTHQPPLQCTVRRRDHSGRIVEVREPIQARPDSPTRSGRPLCQGEAG